MFGLKKKQAETPPRFNAGDKVYVSTFVHVYEGEIVAKDESYDVLRPYAPRYIVKIDGELLTIAEDSLTKAPKKED